MMKKKQTSLRWLIASLSMIAFLLLSLNQLDNQQLYQSLKHKFSQAGITLQAKQVQLSWVYLGSIRLDDVTMQSNAFELSAQHIFIDLDLAALLTGQALAQALYLQFAEIDIRKEQQASWLNLISSSHFKLKRIDISQSELHFEEQHLTLEQVDLDIRDIGKNKNPRLELRAHIGEGRIDAHGYLHLKRGDITRGFGRLRLYDIPVAQWYKHTALKTLNGTITTHINQQQQWQAFGHLSINDAQRSQVALRGKISGHGQKKLKIEGMVLDVQQVGLLAISGSCAQQGVCKLDLSSPELLLAPMLTILNQHQAASIMQGSAFSDLKVALQWENHVLSSSGGFAWSGLDTAYMQLGPVVLDFSHLQTALDGMWGLARLHIGDKQSSTQGLTVARARYKDGKLLLPMTLNDTSLWLPLSQLAAWLWAPNMVIEGQGQVQGQVDVVLQGDSLRQMNFVLDGEHAAVQVEGWKKPQNVMGQVDGYVTIEQDAVQAKVHAALAGQQLDLSYHGSDKGEIWTLGAMTVRIESMIEAGLVVPAAWQPWHGEVKGDAVLIQEQGEAQLQWKQGDLTLQEFGFGGQSWTGQVQKNEQGWLMQQLLWSSGQYRAALSSDGRGHVDIEGDLLDSNMLSGLLPFQAKGRLSSKTLRLPFADLKDFSADYVLDDDAIRLSKVKSDLYQGTLQTRALDVSWADDGGLSIVGSLQLGGVGLSRWHWLQQQFQSHLEGSLYATLNIQAYFTVDKQLKQWSGDGDLAVYDAKWLLDGSNISADLLDLKVRKRTSFVSTMRINKGKVLGFGRFLVDEQGHISGELEWQNKRVMMRHDWPNLHYKVLKP